MKYRVTLTLDTVMDSPFVEDFVRRAIDGFLDQENNETVTDVKAHPIADDAARIRSSIDKFLFYYDGFDE